MRTSGRPYLRGVGSRRPPRERVRVRTHDGAGEGVHELRADGGTFVLGELERGALPSAPALGTAPAAAGSTGATTYTTSTSEM